MPICPPYFSQRLFLNNMKSTHANPWKQNYDAYTKEDQKVWRILFDRQMKILPDVASSVYLEGIRKIDFRKDRIPDFQVTNLLLESLTGWSLHEVPGILPVRDFFELLHKKKFSATTWLRKMSQLDYLEEPDMFHDVFAHVPLLTNNHFCDFFHGVSKIAMKYVDHPQAVELLGRLYWFTVEFGLIWEEDSYKIYGAGILSSGGETAYCLGSEPERVPYDVQEIFNTPYRTDVFQQKYFVIDSFEQLYHSLGQVEEILKRNLNLLERAA